MTDFLLNFSRTEPHVVWFDHDWRLDLNLKEDVLLAGTKLPPSSFFFLTVSAEPAKPIRKSKPKERLQWFDEQFGDFAHGLSPDELSDGKYRHTAATVLLRIVKFAFNARLDGTFYPVLKLLYRDSSWMMTVGGVFCESDRPAHLLLLQRQAMPFLPGFKSSTFYQVPQFNITDAERRLLDRVATQPSSKRRDRIFANRLGFDADFRREYGNLVRYIPRYFESFT